MHGLRDSVASVRAASKRAVVACPRVLKPGEDGLARFYLRLGADALLIRSAGLLYRLSRAGGAGATVRQSPLGGSGARTSFSSVLPWQQASAVPSYHLLHRGFLSCALHYLESIAV